MREADGSTGEPEEERTVPGRFAMYPFEQRDSPIVLPQGWGAIALDAWRPWGAGDREAVIPFIEVDGYEVVLGFDRVVVVVPAGEHTISDWSPGNQFIPRVLRGQVTVAVNAGVVVAIEHIVSVTIFLAPGQFRCRGARPAHTFFGAMILTLVAYGGAFVVAMVSALNVTGLFGVPLFGEPLPDCADWFLRGLLVAPMVLFLRYWRWPRQPFRRGQRPDLPTVVTRDDGGIERPARVVSLTDARVPDRS